MPSNKSHHYVPKLLLSRFHEEHNDRAIALLNLKSKRVIRGASIKDQAARDWLYGKDQVVENSLKPLEGTAANWLREIDATGAVPRVGSVRAGELIFFAAVQWARTPAAGAEIDAIVRAQARLKLMAEHKRGRYLNVKIDDVRLRKENPITDSLKLVIGERTFELLADLAWELVTNEADVEFVLPDTGVVLHNQWRQGDLEHAHLGFASAGLQLFFPIAPRALLVAYDTDVYARRAGKKEGSVLRRNQDVRQVNMLMLSDAVANVYFTGHERTAAQISGAIPRSSPRHEASRQEVEDDGSRLMSMLYRSPAGVAVELPVLRMTKAPPRDSTPSIRAWPRLRLPTLRQPRPPRFDF